MLERHWIADLPSHVGSNVAVQGWVVTTRSSGKIAFVVLRDGSGYLQGVVVRNAVPPEAWDRFASLTQEACVRLEGQVRADQRAPGGVELTVSDLAVLGPSVDFPITPKEHGTAFLMERRHLWLRSRRQTAIMRVRHEVIQAIRDFFHERGFSLVDTPILSGSIGESAPEPLPDCAVSAWPLVRNRAIPLSTARFDSNPDRPARSGNSRKALKPF